MSCPRCKKTRMDRLRRQDASVRWRCPKRSLRLRVQVEMSVDLPAFSHVSCICKLRDLQVLGLCRTGRPTFKWYNITHVHLTSTHAITQGAGEACTPRKELREPS
jgi:hypothetical protein